MESEDKVKIEIASDLAFQDESLERVFRRFHMESQRKMDVQFHIARCLAWAAVGIRMMKDSSAFHHYVASGIVLFGAITTLFPAFAYSVFRNQNAYCRYRPAVVVADNVLQVALGCVTHQHIYPEGALSWDTASSWRAVAVFVTGSGFAWLNMSGLLGSLPFRFAWPQQAVLVVMMMLASPDMCRRSFSLQKAHISVFKKFFHSLGKKLPHGIVDYIAGEIAVPVAALEAGEGISKVQAYTMCFSGQAWVLLALGFIFPTYFLFRQELRMRKRFLQGTQQCYYLFPEPTLLNYMTFAIPAVSMLYMYVAKNIQ
jgi:hypothetical protein